MFVCQTINENEITYFPVYPNILQTTAAALSSKSGSQIDIQDSATLTSIAPSHGPFPPTNCTSVASVRRVLLVMGSEFQTLYNASLKPSS